MPAGRRCPPDAGRSRRMSLQNRDVRDMLTCNDRFCGLYYHESYHEWIVHLPRARLSLIRGLAFLRSFAFISPEWFFFIRFQEGLIHESSDETRVHAY
jgi:hypothetical protein